MQGGWGKGVLIHQTFSGFKVAKLVKLITMKVVHDPQGDWENIQNKQLDFDEPFLTERANFFPVLIFIKIQHLQQLSPQVRKIQI